MRILIVSQYFWPESFRINELAIALQFQGHVVNVLTGKPNYPAGSFFEGYKGLGCHKEVWHGIPIYRIPLLARGRRSGFRLTLNYFSFILSGLLFAPFLLRKYQYDVIFVYGVSPIFQVIPASFLGWLRRIPVVLWVQDLWPESAQATGYVRSAWMLKLIEELVRFSYMHTDLLLVQSKAFIPSVKKLAPRHVPVLYYPNSVEDAFYTPQALEVPYIDVLQDGFSVLFAGNIGVAQSVETIVDVAKLLKNYTQINIVMMGSGSMSDWVVAQKQQFALDNLHLVGRFPVEMMPLLMRQASVLLVTLRDSPIFSLTIPNKTQAYLAVGKPIIACLNGEGAKLVEMEAQAGVAVNAEDAEGLAQAIIQLYQMSESQRLQMGNRGRAYFKEHFDHQTLVIKLVGYLENVVRDVRPKS